MKKYYVCVSKYFEDWIEAKTEEEAEDKAFELFEREQTNIFIDSEEEV